MQGPGGRRGALGKLLLLQPFLQAILESMLDGEHMRRFDVANGNFSFQAALHLPEYARIQVASAQEGNGMPREIQHDAPSQVGTTQILYAQRERFGGWLAGGKSGKGGGEIEAWRLQIEVEETPRTVRAADAWRGSRETPGLGIDIQEARQSRREVIHQLQR